jgi:CheY-like chemotaxis protein
VIIDMIRALVADDDPLLLDVVTAIFERLGFEVTCATSGGELLDCIASGHTFDIVVTDVAMPWMSGLQVMHSARAAGLPCPVVIMTGSREPYIFAQVAALTGGVLLLKPFTLVQLNRALRAAFALTPLTPQYAAAPP